MSLYSRLLGLEFHSLPPVLKRFHGAPCRAEGTFSVVRRRGRFGPRTGTWNGSLLVKEVGQTELWNRTIGTWSFVTSQTYDDGLLLEQYGPWRLWFEVAATHTGMDFTQRKVSLCGFRLPERISPRVRATVVGNAQSWHVAVSLHVPLLGEAWRYEGDLWPE